MLGINYAPVARKRSLSGFVIKVRLPDFRILSLPDLISAYACERDIPTFFVHD